jgi:hypothetical protein
MFSDKQNMYNRETLLCTVNYTIHTQKLGPTANSQEPGTTGAYKIVLPLLTV